MSPHEKQTSFIPEAGQVFYLDQWLIEPEANRISLRQNAGDCPPAPAFGYRTVEPRLMQLLCYLAIHHGQVLSRDKLMERLWPEVVVNENSLTRAVSELRKRLSHDEAGLEGSQLIETIPKVGYRIPTAVNIAAAESVPASKDTAQVAQIKETRLTDPRESRWLRLASAAALVLIGTVLGSFSLTFFPGADQTTEALAGGEPAMPALTRSWSPGSQFATVGEFQSPENPVSEPFTLNRLSDPPVDTTPVVSRDGNMLAFISRDDSGSSVLVSPTRMASPPLTVFNTRDIIYNLQWSPLDNALLFAQKPRSSTSSVSLNEDIRLVMLRLDTMTPVVIDTEDDVEKSGKGYDSDSRGNHEQPANFDLT